MNGFVIVEYATAAVNHTLLHVHADEISQAAINLGILKGIP